MKRVLFFTVPVLFFFCFTAQAQFNNSGAQLRNVDFQYNGENIMITYDIANANPKHTFYVFVNAYSENGNKFDVNSLSGDTYGISGGSGKQIIWHIKNDNVELDEKIYFELSARIVQQPSLGKALAKSAIMPGLGKSEYGKKGRFVVGILGYGCIGSALLMNKMATDNRQNYLNAASPDEADDYHDKMKKQNMLSYALAGTAAVIWTVDIAGIISKHSKQKNLSPEKIRSSSYPLITGRSAEKFINTRAPIRPPMLSIAKTSIKFVDENNNKAIDANEQCRIEFLLNNAGEGTGYGLTLQVKEKNGVRGLSYTGQRHLGDIDKKTQQRIEIPLDASMQLNDGRADFTILIKETNGFDTDPIEISIPTYQFAAPNVVVADYQFSTTTGGIAKASVPINLKMVVQNIGQGTANDIKLQLSIPENVFVTNLSSYDIGTLQAGESKEINFEFFANKRYDENDIPVKGDLSESYGKYAQDKTMRIALDTELQATNKVVVTPDERSRTEIEKVSLVAETDRNIPLSAKKHNKRYALIIGNEDYTTYQSELNDESNVDFARNDAQIFAQYAERTLGVPSENITLITDAISSVMSREIKRLINKAQYGNGDEELIFYYSGHGFPDNKTKEGYIMPVDISGANVTDGIKLSKLYRDLTQYPTARVTVFLDACFSGGGREQGLLAAKAVRIKSKTEQIEKGNIVVFSASSGEQESLFFDEKKHGIFTYCLLKKLQDTKGNITYGELAEYLKQQVAFIASDKMYKEQNPEVNISPDVKKIWRKWKMN